MVAVDGTAVALIRIHEVVRGQVHGHTIRTGSEVRGPGGGTVVRLLLHRTPALHVSVYLAIVEGVAGDLVLPALDALDGLALAGELQVDDPTGVRNEDGQRLLLGLVGHEEIGGAAIQPAALALVPARVILALPELDLAHLLEVSHARVHGEGSLEVLRSVAVEEPCKVVRLDRRRQRIVQRHGVVQELVVEAIEEPLRRRVRHEQVASVRIQGLVEHELQEGVAVPHLVGGGLKIKKKYYHYFLLIN